MNETLKPGATDEEIAQYNGEIAIYQRDRTDGYLRCVQCDASPGSMGGHRPFCDFTTWPRIRARIESDRAALKEAKERAGYAKEESRQWKMELDKCHFLHEEDSARADKAEALVAELVAACPEYVAGQDEANARNCARYCDSAAANLHGKGRAILAARAVSVENEGENEK